MIKRAFTLIELLVVIAIIAILAAILFPVFAQAKEAAKKTQTTSNMKQMATSAMIYVADYDDLFPSAYSINPNGRIWWEYGIEIPQGWTGPAFEKDDAQHVLNSLQPYMKNYDILVAAGMPKYKVGGVPYNAPAKPWKNMTIGMNGLLNVYPVSAVANPSQLTLFWPEEGKVQVEGIAYSNPTLRCAGTAGTTCRFSPASVSMTGGSTGAGGRGDLWFASWSPTFDTAWHYGKGFSIAFSDTSTKYFTFNPSGKVHTGAEMERNYKDPAATYGANGFMATGHRCAQGATTTVTYLSFFRPDSEFRYDFGTGSSAIQCRN